MPNNKLPKHVKKELKFILKKFPPNEMCKRLSDIIQLYKCNYTMATELKINHLQVLQSLLCVFSRAKKSAAGIKN